MGTTQSKTGQYVSNGMLLLFSHDKFDDSKNLQERHGNSIDVDKIKETFTKLGFKQQCHLNLTAHQIMSTINYYANVPFPDCEDTSCFVVIVLSHGGPGGKLHAKDTVFNTHDIWEPFKTSQNLKNKPKIFVFQACRGDTCELVLNPESSVPHSTNNVNINSEPLAYVYPKVPHQSHFLIAKSTIENRSCVRDNDHGTWYIQCLCDVLDLLTSPTDVVNVLTRVNSAVIERSILSTSFGQTPIFTSFLHEDVIVPSIANGSEYTRAGASGSQSTNSKSSMETDSSGPNIKDLFSRSLKINTLNTDAANGKVKTQYEWKHSSRGRAIIFHAPSYKSQANDVAKTLKNMQFNKPSVHEIIGGNNLADILDQVSKDQSLEIECCLVVAIIAQIEEEVDALEPHVEKLNIITRQDSFAMSCSWHPFIASNCSAMCDKPKIFLFLDPQVSTDAGSVGPNLSSSLEPSIQKAAVTDHADFLFIHGYGQEFLKAILQQINKNPWDNKCLLTKVKMAMKSEKKGLDKKRSSYFESTLKYELVFHRMEIIEEKITVQSAINVDCRVLSKDEIEYEVDEAIENYTKEMKAEFQNSSFEDFEAKHKEILDKTLLGFKNKIALVSTADVDSEVKKIQLRIRKPYKNYSALNAKCQAISVYKKAMDMKCNSPVSVASPEDMHDECFKKAQHYFTIKTFNIIDESTKQCYEEILKMDAEKLFEKYKIENTNKMKREFQTGSGRCHSEDNQELVKKIKETIFIPANVENAMMKTDRANYMLPSSRNYQDKPCGIGYKTTISAPHMHAHALKHLSDLLVEGAKVLDVGSGSGYLTVCMAHMVGESGIVIGVDHIPELVDYAMANINRENPEFLTSKRIHFLVGDGRKGVASFGPYDVIHVGAASEEIPPALLEQLKPGGRMLIPVGPLNENQKWTRVDKLKNGKIVKRELFGVRFVSLTDKDKQLN